MSYIIQHKRTGCYAASSYSNYLVTDPHLGDEFVSREAALQYIERKLVPHLYAVAVRPETRLLLTQPRELLYG